MSKKKMYYTTQKTSNNMILHIEHKKPRTQMTTVRSEQYSFMTRASRRAKHQEKKALRKLDICQFM